jgi:hypothetical protein|tara:strand:+ start:309 stop:476 length:168 start_codon:yes stop_codon:yes gene_type:complete
LTDLGLRQGYRAQGPILHQPTCLDVAWMVPQMQAEAQFNSPASAHSQHFGAIGNV